MYAHKKVVELLRILGIDPGYAIVGYGILDYNANHFDVVGFGAITTGADMSFSKRLEAIYNDTSITSLADFNIAIHRLVFDFLDLPIDVEYVDELPEMSEGVVDLRGKVGMSSADGLDWIADESYWQVWQDRHGFRPDQSIFDLLMTNGREALFILERMIK